MEISYKDCPAKSYCKGYSSLCSSMCVAYNQLKELYKYSNIPRRFKEPKPLTGGFGGFSFLNVVDAYISSIKENVRQGKGLYIYSKTTGNGKTHSATNILHYYFKAIAGENFGVGKGVFINLTDFFVDLKASIGLSEEEKTGIEQTKYLIRNADLVVFDDIGSERPTGFVVEMLYKLINERYNEQKAMIFTSNLSLEELGRWHPRIASRIAEVCEAIHFTAPDYRLLKK